MGAVYHAHHGKLDRDVALKILHPKLAMDPEFAERFFREARVLAKLNHPNIVAVHDVDHAGPYLYLLMEYVEGATLKDLMLTGRIESTSACSAAQPILFYSNQFERSISGHCPRIRVSQFHIWRNWSLSVVGWKNTAVRFRP
jgi:serine/threonine protein kinase